MIARKGTQICRGEMCRENIVAFGAISEFDWFSAKTQIRYTLYWSSRGNRSPPNGRIGMAGAMPVNTRLVFALIFVPPRLDSC
jgi:hypothetical protein